MSGGFYLNGREVSDASPYGEGPSHQAAASSSSDAVKRLREKIGDAERGKNFDDCLRYATRALKLSPDSMELKLLKARFLVQMNKSDEANEILCDVLQEDPQNANAIFILGQIFYYQGNLKKSVEVISDALEINPLLAPATILKSKAIRLMNIIKNIPEIESPKEKFTGSIKAMIKEGLRIDPDNREVAKILRFHQGVGSFKNRNFRTAIQEFTEALKLDQTNISLFMLRAKSYMELAMHDDAIIDLMEADKLNDCKKRASDITDMRRKIGAAYIPMTNYKLLEIQRNATDSEIVSSYNSLSLLHKVNIGKAANDAEKRKLEFRQKRVANAFGILSDKKLKKRYDKWLEEREASIECPTARACGERCTTGYQCCCAGIGTCFKDSCEGVGSCCEGFGSCMSGSCCSQDGLYFICGTLKFANIFIALVIFGVLYLIFK